jgi:putative spermidine/putrescine transport system substrate-binding protein
MQCMTGLDREQGQSTRSQGSSPTGYPRAWFGVALALILGMAPASPSHAAGKELVVVGWGGVFQEALREAFFKPFEKESGIRILDTTSPSLAKIKAMVDAGKVEWDVVTLSEIDAKVLTAGDKKYLEPIDYTGFSKPVMEGLDAIAKQPFLVGLDYSAMVMAYRKEAYPNGGPQNWHDFWNVKAFPGPRALRSGLSMTGMLEFALLADGVPADKLYPIDTDRAFRKLNEIKPYIIKWWGNPAEAPQLLADKEVVLTDGWHNRLAVAQRSGVPIVLQWNQGLYHMGDTLAVVKGAPNKAEAMQFIAFAMRADRLAKLCEMAALGPTNRDSARYLPVDFRASNPSAPENFKGLFRYNVDYWSAMTPSNKSNKEVFMERWNKWLLE